MIGDFLDTHQTLCAVAATGAVIGFFAFLIGEHCGFRRGYNLAVAQLATHRLQAVKTLHVDRLAMGGAIRK